EIRCNGWPSTRWEAYTKVPGSWTLMASMVSATSRSCCSALVSSLHVNRTHRPNIVLPPRLCDAMLEKRRGEDDKGDGLSGERRGAVLAGGSAICRAPPGGGPTGSARRRRAGRPR